MKCSVEGSKPHAGKVIQRHYRDRVGTLYRQVLCDAHGGPPWQPGHFKNSPFRWDSGGERLVVKLQLDPELDFLLEKIVEASWN